MPNPIVTTPYNPNTLLNRRDALRYAYKGYPLRYTAAIKALVWLRGGT